MEKLEHRIVTNKAGQRILVLPDMYRKLQNIPSREAFDGILYESTSGRLTEFQIFQLDPLLLHPSQFKPFFVHPNLDGSMIIRQMADGLCLHPDDDLLIDEISRIQNRIISLQIDVEKTHVHQTEEAVFGRIMRFYLTRNDYVPTPVLKSGSSYGYLYPLIEFYIKYKKMTAKYAANRVNLLQSSAYIDNHTLLDRVPLCRSCFRSHLIFTETCPYCKSPDIFMEESIHHFKCANISAESSYVKGDELVCPKCRRRLRHIGVDYDRPTAQYHCNICSHTFSTTSMRTTCTACGNVAAPDSMLFFPVHERVYFTELGKEVFSRSVLIDADASNNPLLVDQETFQAYVRNRVAIYGVTGSPENRVTVTQIKDMLDRDLISDFCYAINEMNAAAVFTHRKGTLFVVQLGERAKEVFQQHIDLLNDIYLQRTGVGKFMFESMELSSTLEQTDYINMLSKKS